MREFRFRAWDAKNQRMVYEPFYFDVYHYSDENRVNQMTHRYYEDWRDLKDGRGWECELMQYTGLKDKNGKEIYEGDVLKSRNFYFEVRWINAAFHLVNRSEVRYGPRHYSLTPNNSKGLLVLGNIYENIKAKVYPPTAMTEPMKTEKLTMWQLQIFGSVITTAYLKDALSIIEDESEELANGEHIKLTKVLMTQEEYEKLPEFEGY